MLNNQIKEKIAELLEQKKQGYSCPMCQNKSFIMADGFFNNYMMDDFNSISIGGPSIPTIAIICNNCGFVSQHALGVLGLLPNEEIKNKEIIKKDESNE